MNPIWRRGVETGFQLLGENTPMMSESLALPLCFIMLPDYIFIRDSCGEKEYSEAQLNFMINPKINCVPYKSHRV